MNTHVFVSFRPIQYSTQKILENDSKDRLFVIINHN